MPLRYQRGHLRCVKRKFRKIFFGEKVWKDVAYVALQLRALSMNIQQKSWPRGRSMVFPCDLIFHDIGLHETAIVTILEFRSQCHF